MQQSTDDCYTEDGAPVKCWKCGCTQIDEKTTDSLGVGVGYGLTLEAACICRQCGEHVGYWAHGSYDPCYMQGISAANPEIEKTD